MKNTTKNTQYKDTNTDIRTDGILLADKWRLINKQARDNGLGRGYVIKAYSLIISDYYTDRYTSIEGRVDGKA